ncbi:putative membrane protein [Helicobacter pylori CCHI 33]|nr:putative membrane protein [Helicobacter pylori CCHI 33]
MVKERPEEARNSLKGNFYSFLPLLWGSFGGFGSLLFSAFIFCFYFLLLFSAFIFCFYFLLFYSLFCSLFFIKISK